MINKKEHQLLPFFFKKLDNDSYLITNESGEYQFLSNNEFEQFTNASVENEHLLNDLKSKNFVAYDDIELSLNMLSTKFRTRKSFLRHFTSLHMMVITLRCNHQCRYCQLSSHDKSAYQTDMSIETAAKILEHIFCTPSKTIKIEFQGGEPLLNWETIAYTILHAEKLNETHKKFLDFVICTNLTLIKDWQLEFFKTHKVSISTSLDGPKSVHDKNRVICGQASSYDCFLEKLALSRKILGHDFVSALVTISKDNLSRLPEIIDEYKKNGFDGIFLRSLNPYGAAVTNEKDVGYDVSEFVQAFEIGLDHIIKMNLAGERFVEYYTTLLLTRILTSFSTGFVDLQSPSGAGISGAIYDHNGDVYPADEARMLARMGDKRFLMGNVFKNSYLDIFTGPVITEIAQKSCLQILPECSACAYQPYCGADPIRNYLESGDLMGCRSKSAFCKKQKGILDILFRKLRTTDQNIMNIFWSWITHQDTI